MVFLHYQAYTKLDLVVEEYFLIGYQNKVKIFSKVEVCQNHHSSKTF